MNQIYKKILGNFSSNKDFVRALLENNKIIYLYLSQILMLNNPTYKSLLSKEGRTPAEHIVMDSLIVFRRQVKHKKIDIFYKGKKIVIKNKSGQELSDYLSNLFLLIYKTSNLNPAYQQSEKFATKLKDGSGIAKLYELKNSILGSLRNFGCTNQQDQEDILQESLVLFWKKIIDGEFGIYYSDTKDNIENCHVYNSKFYQNSKLNTFLTGIARNLFLNRTRSSEYKSASDIEPDIVLEKKYELPEMEQVSPTLLMFYYYRCFVEKRNLRTIISILRQDCMLEENEIKNILGINNARIHSSRLKAHFLEWYDQNENKEHEISDLAHEYFRQRELKKIQLNEKIRTIDRYHRNKNNHIDLDIYQEEFKTLIEFTENSLTFKQTFYFASIGKLSALTGLPDEKLLKESMNIFKKKLDKLQNIQVIFFLLFYGSDEPSQVMIELIKNLYLELKESPQNQRLVSQLFDPLEKHESLDQSALTNKLYQTNCLLFDILSKESSFKKLTTQDETL